MANTHKYQKFLDLSTHGGMIKRSDAENACLMAWGEGRIEMMNNIVDYSPDIQDQFKELERLIESYTA